MFIGNYGEIHQAYNPGLSIRESIKEKKHVSERMPVCTPTCVLLAQLGHNLWRPLQVSVHMFLPQPPHHHAHPLQRRREGELTHDADLVALGTTEGRPLNHRRSSKHTAAHF